MEEAGGDTFGWDDNSNPYSDEISDVEEVAQIDGGNYTSEPHSRLSAQMLHVISFHFPGDSLSYFSSAQPPFVCLGGQ